MRDDRLNSMLDMAREAGLIAQNMRTRPASLKIREKGPMDLLTAADIAVEALLRDRIEALEPNVTILGEEGGLTGTGSVIWIIDPIDGTVNFSRGTPNWAISIGRFDGITLTHGVIHAPDLGMTAWARRGLGCYLNDKRITFNPAVVENPIMALGYSPRTSLQEYFASISALLDAGVEHRRYGAATICFLGILAGWFDAFHEGELNIWDAAAGLLLIEEAGGVTTHNPFKAFIAGPSRVTALNAGFPKGIFGIS